MCEAKTEAKTKADQLIDSIDKLTVSIDNLIATAIQKPVQESLGKGCSEPLLPPQ
jgi:hypothetical protein